MLRVPLTLRLPTATDAPYCSSKSPVTLVSPVSALLLPGVLLSATRALVPERASRAPLPMLVISPLPNSMRASPVRLAVPVHVPGAAAAMFSVACAFVLASVLPSMLIVPVLLRPAALTVVGALRLPPPVPMLVVPLFASTPVRVSVPPPAPPEVSTLTVPELARSPAMLRAAPA